MPSSLTRGRSSALVSSTSPPVSVYGTGGATLPTKPFVPVQVLATCAPVAGCARTRFSAKRPTSLNGPRLPARHPPQGLGGSSSSTGAGISTGCPSPTPCGLGLGPTNPLRSARAAEALGMRQWGFSPHLTLLIPTFALVSGPHGLALRLLPADDAPLPPQQLL